jgi:hypothetical protein
MTGDVEGARRDISFLETDDAEETQVARPAQASLLITVTPHPPDDAPPPWEQPGAVRRDVEPHRGGLLRALGVTSLIFGGLAPVLVVTALVAFPLGAAVWVIARRDLRQMAAGSMDSSGCGATKEGRDCGAVAAVLSLLAALVALFLAVVLSAFPGV